MPDDLLNLNLGQVQAVINGYSKRLLDDTVQSVWTGYYVAYYISSKHPKKPTDFIKMILDSDTKKQAHSDVDIQAEIDLFAQRELNFLKAERGNK